MEATDHTKLCPVCGGVNSHDAVFCANADCRKALGEFPYVLEEFDAERRRLHKIADQVAAFAGAPHFVTTHLVWFGIWILINSGAVAMSGVFDAYPYSLLGLILSIEATLLSGFLLISNGRQNALAEKRAQLDYEVNVRTYRLLAELHRKVDEVFASRSN